MCKYCSGSNVVKNGIIKEKQRYLCRGCDRTFRDGDKREKYSIEKKIRVIKMYTESVGLRGIERVEGVSTPLLLHWIKGFSNMIKDKLNNTKIPEDAREVEILEMDELFTYYKKKTKKPMCGLLWIGTEIKLLVSQ